MIELLVVKRMILFVCHRMMRLVMFFMAYQIYFFFHVGLLAFKQVEIIVCFKRHSNIALVCWFSKLFRSWKGQLAQIWFLFLVETDQKQNSIGRVYVIRRFRFSDSSYRNCQFMHFVYQVHTQLYIQTWSKLQTRSCVHCSKC